MNVGANSFGLRDSYYAGMDKAIEDFKYAGLTSVEVCVDFPSNMDARPDFPTSEAFKTVPAAIWSPEDAVGKIKQLREAGFNIISCHAMSFFNTGAELEALVPMIIDFAKQNDIYNFVISPMKPLSVMKELAESFRKVSDALAAEGINFMIHNHEIECMMEDGTTVLDYMFGECPNLKLELDVGWAKFAGADAIELMEKWKDRLVLVHLKDIKADASPETRDNCFTAIGEGSIPLPKIIAKSKELGICVDGIILDQDASMTSMVEDIKTGVKNVNTCE